MDGVACQYFICRCSSHLPCESTPDKYVDLVCLYHRSYCSHLCSVLGSLLSQKVRKARLTCYPKAQKIIGNLAAAKRRATSIAMAVNRKCKAAVRQLTGRAGRATGWFYCSAQFPRSAAGNVQPSWITGSTHELFRGWIPFHGGVVMVVGKIDKMADSHRAGTDFHVGDWLLS